MLVKLARFGYTPMGTFGRLSLPEGQGWYTVERPWADNAPRTSCIPVGRYGLRLGRFERGDYPAYELLRVPGRTLIKIHIANTMDDVEGCIGLGQVLGSTGGRWAVVRARAAFADFMAVMGGALTAEIEITNSVGGVCPTPSSV